MTYDPTSPHQEFVGPGEYPEDVYRHTPADVTTVPLGIRPHKPMSVAEAEERRKIMEDTELPTSFAEAIGLDDYDVRNDR